MASKGASRNTAEEGREPRMENFNEFWEFYVGQHSKPATQWWHFVATASALLLVLAALATSTWLLVPLGIVLGYSLAWYSHFFVEGNRPASFGHPFWSFACDWRMFALLLTGRMDAEVRRIQKSHRQG